MNGYKIKNEEVEDTKEQLSEMRPLPLGREEFESWFERLWEGAMVKAEPGKEDLLKLSVQGSLCHEVHLLPAGQDHQTDAYFIKRIRKLAANQVCLEILQETKAKLKTLQDLQNQEPHFV